jgi:hypothetical protein
VGHAVRLVRILVGRPLNHPGPRRRSLHSNGQGASCEGGSRLSYFNLARTGQRRLKAASDGPQARPVPAGGTRPTRIVVPPRGKNRCERSRSAINRRPGPATRRAASEGRGSSRC